MEAEAGDSQEAQWCAVHRIFFFCDKTHALSAEVTVPAIMKLKFYVVPLTKAALL